MCDIVGATDGQQKQLTVRLNSMTGLRRSAVIIYHPAHRAACSMTDFYALVSEGLAKMILDGQRDARPAP